MSRITLLLLLTLLLTSIGESQQASLDRFLREKDFYDLRIEFNRLENSMNEYEKLLYSSFVLSAYNEPKRSNEKIRILLAAYKDKLSVTLIVQLYETRITNSVRLFEYRTAWEDSNYLISNYADMIDSNKLAEIKNSNLIWEALRDIPKQHSFTQKGDTIAMQKDKAGLWNIPVSTGPDSDEFIFDTGANLSVVSESIAKRNRWKTISLGLDVGTATGEKVKGNIAIAESIKIGKSVFRNVVFLILPDEKLTIKVNPMFGYVMNGIIGIPVIKEFGKIEIHRSGAILIPNETPSIGLYNLAFVSFTPRLYATVDGEVLGFKFDTGASTRALFKAFLDRYRRDFSIAKTVYKTIGGAGGTKRLEVFQLENLRLGVGRQITTLKNISVYKENRNNDEITDYGVLGQDVFKQYEYVVLNFRDMSFELGS